MTRLLSIALLAATLTCSCHRRSIKSKTCQGVISVKDFGAVGDGKAHDGAAIANAHAVAKECGGSIYFPPGTYRQ